MSHKLFTSYTFHILAPSPCCIVQQYHLFICHILILTFILWRLPKLITVKKGGQNCYVSLPLSTLHEPPALKIIDAHKVLTCVLHPSSRFTSLHALHANCNMQFLDAASYTVSTLGFQQKYPLWYKRFLVKCTNWYPEWPGSKTAWCMHLSQNHASICTHRLYNILVFQDPFKFNFALWWWGFNGTKVAHSSLFLSFFFLFFKILISKRLAKHWIGLSVVRNILCSI